MLDIRTAFVYSAIMGAVIFSCRLFPFLFFGKDKNQTVNNQNVNGKKQTSQEKFLSFVEKTAPPVAMTVLTFNALSSVIIENPIVTFPAFLASAITAILHLWKRNALISIFSGTLCYMLVVRFIAV